jgi:HPt (histidine-containing phosphotransfer) domain-containing protein
MDIPAADGQAAVDFSRIRETSDGDTDFEKELFGVFLEDCEDRLRRLNEAMAAGRLSEIQREAHTIKGAAANVGTTHLQEIAMHLEGMTDGASPESKALVNALEQEFARVKEAVLAYVATI